MATSRVKNTSTAIRTLLSNRRMLTAPGMSMTTTTQGPSDSRTLKRIANRDRAVRRIDRQLAILRAGGTAVRAPVKNRTGVTVEGTKYVKAAPNAFEAALKKYNDPRYPTIASMEAASPSTKGKSVYAKSNVKVAVRRQKMPAKKSKAQSNSDC